MPEDLFKNLLIGFLLMSLFGMLIMTAVIDVGNTYGKDLTEVSGGSLALNKFNESVSSIEEDAKSMKAGFDKQSVWSTLAGVVVEGIFGIAKDMVLMILSPFDIIADIMSDILSIPSYVTSVILGILIIVMILSIWRLVKIGD